MWTSNKFRNEFVAIICLLFVVVDNQLTTTWTDRPELRMGQTSIYDAVYIPLDTTSQMDVTYKTPFASTITLTGPEAHRGVVLSGFENYLHYQIKVNVAITVVHNDRITVRVYVGTTTYIKQLNINFFVMGSVAGGKYASVEVLSANFMTPDLDDATKKPDVPRFQTLATQSTSITTKDKICSAIQGVDYYNEDGVINEVYISTIWVDAKNYEHKVTVGEKGRLYSITIMTILIKSDYYPASPDPFTTLGQILSTSLKNDGPPKSGFSQLQFMNVGGLFTKDNAFFFGIKGFKFKMQQTRMFLLAISPTTQQISVSNLEASSWQYVDISMMVMVDRACSVAPAGQYYFVERFICMDPATCSSEPSIAPYTTNNLLVDGTNSICRLCASVCDGCANNDVNDCVKCVPGSNRLLDKVPPTTKCTCDIGYVEVNGQVVCQKCSDLIAGCSTCKSETFCESCASPTYFDTATANATHQSCRCADGTYLVTGICLSYPGCLVANIYITGQFCQVCDDKNNFEKKLANNSRCGCKLAYYNDIDPKNCTDRLGDGQTPESPANATDTQIICDDNDTVSGDGCSAENRQEFGYLCTVQTPGGLSVCVEKQEIKINYLYSQKNLIGNQGVIVFALLPPQNSLAENTFENSISMGILPGSKKIKFDPVNSLIMITVDYPSDLESNLYEFNFTFTGLAIYSPDIFVKATVEGLNAKLKTSDTPQQTNIITYVGLGVSAFALGLALISSFLGEKLLGIELILPVQAAFFSMATLPNKVLSPISALWSMKYSNGYNSLQKYDLATNYMLDNRITIMQYSGQYILNYNIMFLLLALVILIIGIIALRIAWLERQEKRIEEIQKKKQDEDKKQPKSKSKSQKDERDTEDESKKDDQINMENLEEELQDTRENIKNWRNFLYMIFDRFFSICVITAMMKVIFCFYIQLSNLTYTAQVYDNSLNAGFFFLSYIAIITGLYTIIYDYKTDKFILFTCAKGKYAMFYIAIFLGYIIVLGAIFQTFVAVYVGAVFALMPIVLIIYQVPYGMKRFDFQAIIAIICQFPFAAMIAVSLMLQLQSDSIKEDTCMIFAYAILGSVGLSIILTIIRLIKVIDCKKVSCVQFTDRKKDSSNDKNKKKNKVNLLEIEMDKDWDEQGSVRAVLYDKKKNEEGEHSNRENKKVDQVDEDVKKNDSKAKDKQKAQGDEEDDEDIDELQKIKMKLRKDLKQKKSTGKVK